MNRIKEFSKKNLRYFAMGIVAILFVLATFFSFGLLNSNKGETLSAGISVNWIDSASSKFAGGSGSASDPYLISSPEEFAYLAYKVNSGEITVHNHYKVTKPINLSLKYWTPIGINGRYFKGSIDFGNNPVIGLTVKEDEESSGLFGNVDSLTITNAVIIDANINVWETGSAGIIAGTVNNSSGVISITNSTIKGTVTQQKGIYPSTKDGIGGLIGSVLEAKSITLNNLSTNISIQAPNRSVNTCIGAYVGYIKSGITNTITNVVATGEIETNSSTTTIKRYKGDFTSDWFYMTGLNGGVPVLKSQYWIGKIKTLTGSQITTQLGNLGYSSSSTASFIPETTMYTITAYSNNADFTSEFTSGVQTRTGSPNAVEGEKVTIVNTCPAGYYCKGYSNVTSGVTISSEDTFIMPAKNVEFTAEWGETVSYLLQGAQWQTKVASALGSDVATINPLIKTITFTKTQPTTGTTVSVGATGEGSSSANSQTAYYSRRGIDDVTAYITGDSTNGYNVTFYSPVTIYAPNYSYYLFSNSTNSNCLKGLTSLDLSNFNTSSVTYMAYMFYNCSSLTSLAISNFNTSSVTYMGYMFRNCSSLTSLDVSNFNTSSVTSMSYMFYNCSSLTSLALTNFNTSSVTYMQYMFGYCSSLTSLDLSNFNTNKVISMSYMFQNCSKLTSLNVSNFNTSSVKDMPSMFEGCSSLTSLNLTNFNTSSVTDMSYMFSGCSKLTSLNLSNFDTSSVTNMGHMFYICVNLTSMDVSNFNTSYVKKMSYMFYGCSKLTSLDVSNFNTSSVTSMSCMFRSCSSLISLDFSNFITSKVTDMSYMFYDCSKLTSLDLSNFDMTKVTNVTNMLSGCSALKVLQSPQNVKVAISLPSTFYDASLTSYTSIASGTTASLDLRRGYTVTFDPNGGSVTPTSKTVRYGKTYGETKNLPTPTRTGYTFNGWFTASSGGEQITNDTTVTITASQTLYAHWIANTYTISYTLNGGTATTKPTTATYDTAFTVSNPTRTGYTFAGWNISGMDSVTHTYGSSTITATSITGTKATSFKNLRSTSGTVTFTATWTANTYTISYTLNGGTATTKPTTATYDTAFTVSNPTRTGYTFAGWNITGMDSVTHTYGSSTTTATSITGTKETSFKNLRSTSGTVTFTATWTANTYTITFNANGGSVSPTTKRVTYASQYGALPIPTRTGYTFGGWYTAINGTKITDEEGYLLSDVSGYTNVYTQWIKTSDTTFYASWVAKTFNISGYSTSFVGDVFTGSMPTTGTFAQSITVNWATNFCTFNKTVLYIIPYGLGEGSVQEIDVTNVSSYTWTMSTYYNDTIRFELKHKTGYYSTSPTQRIIKITSPSETDGFGVTINHDEVGTLTKSGENIIPQGGNYPSGTIDFTTKSRLAGQARRTIKVYIYGLSTEPTITSNKNANSFTVSKNSSITPSIMCNYYLITFESRAGINLYSYGTVKFDRPEYDKDIYIKIVYENT